MKFGSVGFFKKLIVAVFIALIVVPTVLAVVLGFGYYREKKRADWLELVNNALLNSTEFPEGLQNADEVMQFLQNPPENFTIGPSFDYQKDYLDLYTARPEKTQTEGKVCYLTFDDGPSTVTLQVLKTLEDYGIQATFFVTGQNSEANPEILQQAAAAGHTVAVHTYSHDYKTIYASVDAFLEDYARMNELILETTGVQAGIFRFAGGTVNTHNQYIYPQLTAEMLRRGFVYYDWNVAANDAVVGGISRQAIVDNVLQGTGGQDKIIVLMHDRQDNLNTALALPAIIEGLQAQGYTFAPLTPDVEPYTYA